MGMPTVLLADDHPVITDGVASGLALFGMPVVSVVHDGARVTAAFEEHRPDVAVLDVRLGGVSGLSVAREILTSHPPAKLIFFSQYEQVSIIAESYRIGVKGYVTKDQSMNMLAHAIRNVHSGGVFFMPGVSDILVTHPAAAPSHTLTPREMRALKLLATGLTVQEVALDLGVTRKTAGLVCAAVRRKLGASRTAELVRLAINFGVVDA
ncbi:MAG: response regulator transcription factor [Burkholderiales bacterium]|nr:MAG: response regulator transcription factor [Burkholderiales bacterium]